MRSPAQAVIMAGGLGNRLGRLRDRAPKILQPVAGRPFIEWLALSLAERGFERLHFCLGHRSREILRALQDDQFDHFQVSWTIDPYEGAGTGVALRSAASELDEQFVLWLGDTYLVGTLELPAGDAEAFMILSGRCEDVRPNALIADGYVSYCKDGGEAYALCDSGVAVLSKRLVQDPMLGAFPDLERWWTYLGQSGRLLGSETCAQVFDIGSPERIAALEAYFRDRKF